MKNEKCLKIVGNRYINGIIKVSGSKNAALPIIAASLLCSGEVVLENIPNIKDVNNMLEILKYLNVKCSFNENRVVINSINLVKKNLIGSLVSSFRASYYLIPILLEENDTLEFINVGGCNFEKRPIDIHLDLLKNVGAKIKIENDRYKIRLDKFKELNYTFTKQTVGGTINAILLGIKTKQKVNISNYCKDPEVLDFVSFLTSSGLDVKMDDYSISFCSKSQLNGINYQIMNDRIEAETFALLGLALGRIGIFGFQQKHHQGFLSFLDENDIVYTLEDDFLLVNKEKNISNVKIDLDVYPSLSTDIGPILFSYLLLGNRMFLIRDNIYKTRLSKLRFFQSSFSFQHDYLLVNPLKINRTNNIFYGSNLRDTMSYVFYSLTHEGVYYVYGIEHLKRGYEDIIDKLISLNCIVEEEYEI